MKKKRKKILEKNIKLLRLPSYDFYIEIISLFNRIGIKYVATKNHSIQTYNIVVGNKEITVKNDYIVIDYLSLQREQIIFRNHFYEYINTLFKQEIRNYKIKKIQDEL